MKDFEYFAPKTVEESLSLLSQYKGEAKIIAGGQSMLVVMRQGLLGSGICSGHQRNIGFGLYDL